MSKIETDREIKGLSSQLSIKKADLSTAMVAAHQANNLVESFKRDVKALEKSIEALKAKDDNSAIIVTEHALIRYLERIYKIDIDGVKKEMIGGSEQAIRFAGDGEIKKPSFTLVVKNKTIVTVK